MADNFAYIGGMSIGAALPGAVAALNIAVPDLQARVDALLAFSPGEVSFEANIALAYQIIADCTLAISLGITPPSIAAQIALMLDILGILQAKLQVILDFQGLLASAGLHVYGYSGQVNNLGSHVTSALSGGFPGGAGTDHCNVLILGTSVGATYSAMGGVFVSF